MIEPQAPELCPLLLPDEVEALGDWLTLSDVADLLQISRQALHKQIFAKDGEPRPARQRLLKTVRKVGRSEKPPYLFLESEVMELAARRQAASAVSAGPQMSQDELREWAKAHRASG